MTWHCGHWPSGPALSSHPPPAWPQPSPTAQAPRERTRRRRTRTGPWAGTGRRGRAARRGGERDAVTTCTTSLLGDTSETRAPVGVTVAPVPHGSRLRKAPNSGRCCAPAGPGREVSAPRRPHCTTRWSTETGRARHTPAGQAWGRGGRRPPRASGSPCGPRGLPALHWGGHGPARQAEALRQQGLPTPRPQDALGGDPVHVGTGHPAHSAIPSSSRGTTERSRGLGTLPGGWDQAPAPGKRPGNHTASRPETETPPFCRREVQADVLTRGHGGDGEHPGGTQRRRLPRALRSSSRTAEVNFLTRHSVVTMAKSRL